MTIDRLRNLGAFQIFRQTKNVIHFDLVDDIRDRLEELKDQAGQPSLLAQERDARSRAEERQAHLEVAIERRSRARRARHEAFGARIGRLVKWTAVAALVLLYGGATVLVAMLTTPVPAIAAAVSLLLVIGILDWVFHVDAHGVVRLLEGKAAAAARRWAEQFDPPDDTES